MSDEWQRLKTLAMELTRLTGPGECVCSICEAETITKDKFELGVKTMRWLNPVGINTIEESEGDKLKGLNNGVTLGSNEVNSQPYQRLGEAIRDIVERSSSESSAVLTRHAWCQDVTVYHVWHHIQQSHTESLQLLVRSLSAESSASLAAAAAASASPAGRRFRKDVQQLLEKAFECKPWPNPAEKTMLARRCGLTVRQIGVWFSNRRARCWSVASSHSLVKS